MGTAVYADLSYDDQAAALRPAAVQAAADFGLEIRDLELVLHAYNTTYAVLTPDNQRFALRINTNSRSAAAAVIAQQEWQVAIAAQTPVLVPEPRRTNDGAWFTTSDVPALGHPALITCASWLEGRDVGEPDADVARAMGEAMAQLHLHARTWQLPPEGRMPVFADPLSGLEDRLGSVSLEPAQRAVLDRARAVVDLAYERLYAEARLIPLHADLHGGNLKWQGGRLAVFDFDDSGLGVPALDLAISTFYLRGLDPSVEAALREGYASVTRLPDLSAADFEALVAGRQLHLANDILGSSTAEFAAMVNTYLPRSIERLRAWLETGRFTRET